MKYRIAEMGAPADERFEALYEIYASALPVREQKTREEIFALVGRCDYKIIISDDGHQLLGFAIVFVSATQPVALLEYMATHQDHRNMGLGARIFDASLEAASRRPMLVEVDSERENSADRAIRIRRKNFYRRLGCLQIDALNYVLPLLGEGEPPRMDLLVHPNGREQPISPHEMSDWLGVLYAEVYHQRADDPRIEGMLRNLTNPIILR